MMALTVRDILDLPSGQRMTLLAGECGLDRPVISVEIADYEFAADITLAPDLDFKPEDVMESGGFIITSFLFAKDDPALILPAVQALENMGMAGLAFKRIIYDKLPAGVLDFAEKNNFPIFSFDRDVWFENIIFDIMYAVQFDNKVYLSEEKINTMLSGHMSRSELDIILKGISLKLQQYVSVTYLAGGGIDTGRILRGFYLLKGFQKKGLMVRYGDGLFLIVTSGRDDHKSHNLIRAEAFELMGIEDTNTDPAEVPDTVAGMSDVHKAAELDKAFRESWYCYIASRAEEKPLHRYSETGIYQMLLPAIENSETAAFAKSLTGAFADNEGLNETASEYAASGGDITKTAAALHCHQNTVRYRLGKIRELTGLQDTTDSELYLQLKTAIAIERTRAVMSGGTQNVISKDRRSQ